MKNLTRRIGEAVGMGVIWGAAWFAAGIVVARVPGYDSDLPFALLFAPFGFVAGVLFSGILVSIDGGRTFDRMSLPRVAGWGAAIGLLLSPIFPALRGDWRELLLFGPTLALASALGAAASLAMARRVERRELGAH